jgi:dihydroflavonol-4-reductase
MVYTSSIHAIHAPEDGSLITEATPLENCEEKSRGLYDYSKGCATQYVLENIKNGLKVIILHPTGVSGPFDYRPSFFGEGMVELIKSGIKTTIQGQYDYVDVRDVVSALLKAYELKKYGERYILSGGVLNMKEYTDWLREFTGLKGEAKIIGYNLSLLLGYVSSFFNKKAQITPYSVRTLNSNSNISHEKASRELGFNPRGVKESIFDQFSWFKENGYLKTEK